MQVIVSNYITCIITGSVMRQQIPHNSSLTSDWIGWAIAMGTSFIVLFYIIGFSAQRIGVAVTVTSFKLSLVIPFLFSIYLYNEEVNVWRITGLALALPAVVLTCYQTATPQKRVTITGTLLFILPTIIFVWSGLLDTAIKFVETRFLDGQNNNEFLVMAFAVAAIIGIVILAFLVATKREILSIKSLLAGIALGIPNYFSIWFLVNALKANPGKSAVVLTLNNIAVVLLSAVLAATIFKEKLSLLNWLGIALAAVSILLISGM